MIVTLFPPTCIVYENFVLSRRHPTQNSQLATTLPKAVALRGAAVRVGLLATLGALKRLTRLLIAVGASVVDTAAPAHGSLEILWLEVAVLVIVIRLFERDRDNIENVGRLFEDFVHLLEGSLLGLWEEEVRDRQNQCAISRQH